MVLPIVFFTLTATHVPPDEISVESRTLLSKADVILNERIATCGRIIIRSRTVGPDQSITFSSQEFKADGTPVSSDQEGQWNDRWNVFETRYESKGAVQEINGVKTASTEMASEYRNPTILWFWHDSPKLGESVVVKLLAQNVISKLQIRYTYEGDEEMTLAGRKVKLHRVREDPVGAKGVYTIWWYDDKGMGVRRSHTVGRNEFTYELKAWR